MKKHLLILLLLAFAPGLALRAQPPVVATPVTSLTLPWGLSNLSVVDGRLYACQGGVLVTASMSGRAVTALTPDTTLSRLCPDATYVVRNGGDSLLYFMTSDDDQPYNLNVHTNARFFKNRHVEIKSWFRPIAHPVFSADGNTLIFSAKGKVGLGGYDLWCSFWNGKRWSKPVNLGNAINTAGDEISPAFYGQYLVYSSNGMAGADSTFNLYAVRIQPGTKVDDVIFANYVARPLPEPLNSPGDDTELVFDTLSHRGYWLSTRNGSPQLYAFDGELDGVMLSGTVLDDHSRPIPQAQVRLLSAGRLVSETLTDSTGSYRLFALPADDYQLQAFKPDYFRLSRSVSLYRPNEDLLVAPNLLNLALSKLPFDRPLVFDNIYLEGGDIELSQQAVEALQPIVDYLRDNPNVVAEFTLYSSQSADPEYLNLVIERRISSIQQYLKSCLPSEVRISFKSGNQHPVEMAAGHKGETVFIELFKQ